MEKLWSPWRSQYIDSFNEQMRPTGCIFCDSAKQAVEDDNTLLINKGEYTFSLLNLYPYNNGHLMVVPFRHMSDFGKLNSEESLEMMEKVQVALKVLTKAYNPAGFNVGLNLGKVSGAGIEEHIHFHVVPRWEGDTNFMPVLGDVKVISQDLLETKKKLLEIYQSLGF